MQGKNLEAYFASRSMRTASHLDQVGRAMRDAEMLPLGGRGRHAPQLGPHDKARFLIAASVAKSPADAVASVAEFEKLHAVFPVKGLPLQTLKTAGLKPPFNLIDYLACIFWAPWEQSQKHIRSITLRSRPHHQDLLYRFDAEILGAEGWKNSFEPIQKKRPPESIVRHNQAENTLVTEEVVLQSLFLAGLFSAAKQVG